MINWPPELVSDLARRRAVLFLGSGISAQAKNTAQHSPKTWRAFLNQGAEQLGAKPEAKTEVQRLVNDRDYLTACELLKRELGEAAFNALVIAEYMTPQFKAAPIHDTIIALDSRIVATPNFDKIFESRINALQHGSVQVKHYYDTGVAESIRSTNRVIIKVHGSVDTPTDMIFTRSSYAKARNEHAAFYAIFAALIVTHTFLFLGCGLDDPDVRLLLEDHAFSHSGSKPHYFVLPQGKVVPVARPAVEESMSLKILEYNDANDHAELGESLKTLVADVEAERKLLQDNAQW